ncbi:hypothetical protein X732_32315 [Mesorhizobium sp. L2C066B000]|nr:hypothetical protein X732_32315 [Mesorhizobium sp. L2C066B000]
MCRLAAIAAILRASAGLHAEKAAELDFVGIEILAVNGLREEEEIVEGCIMKRPGCRLRPQLLSFSKLIVVPSLLLVPSLMRE